jgi:hypothetical protein
MRMAFRARILLLGNRKQQPSGDMDMGAHHSPARRHDICRSGFLQRKLVDLFGARRMFGVRSWLDTQLGPSCLLGLLSTSS